MNLLERLTAPGPKRILSLDGGGIRGALTLGYLKQVEDILREAKGNDPAFRLCDYFDLIGGTSTGSIIAACLAIGMKVDDIKEKYFELGGKIFGTKKSILGHLGKLALLDKAEFDAAPLEAELQNMFGDITMGSERIKTGLCVVAKRADTNSIWPILNHPNGKYYNSAEGTNKDIPLWKAVRASAAAPTYFIAQTIEVGGGESKAAFVDGGVSMYNNPSLLLMMVATLKGFPFHWKLGDDRLQLVSVGTGFERLRKTPEQIEKSISIAWAEAVPNMLMQDASFLNETMLQWMSKSPTARSINGEIGNLSDDVLTADPDGSGLVSYLRYNFEMTQNNLNRIMKKQYTPDEVAYLVEMSHADNRYVLYEIGSNAAAEQIRPEHFDKVFL